VNSGRPGAVQRGGKPGVQRVRRAVGARFLEQDAGAGGTPVGAWKKVMWRLARIQGSGVRENGKARRTCICRIIRVLEKRA
jgi:hypothetical protein